MLVTEDEVTKLLEGLDTAQVRHRLGWSPGRFHEFIEAPGSPLRPFARKLIELRRESRRVLAMSEGRDLDPLYKAFKELMAQVEIV